LDRKWSNAPGVERRQRGKVTAVYGMLEQGSIFVRHVASEEDLGTVLFLLASEFANLQIPDIADAFQSTWRELSKASYWSLPIKVAAQSPIGELDLHRRCQAEEIVKQGLRIDRRI